MIPRLLFTLLLFFTALPGSALALKSATSLPDVGLNGIWMDPVGGLFAVRQEGNNFAWIGQGDKGGQYFLHRGSGVVTGKYLKGDWMDLPDSQFYPSQGNISGRLSDDRQVINWQDDSGFYREWVRQMASAASNFASVPGGLLGGEETAADTGSNAGAWDGMAQALQTEGISTVPEKQGSPGSNKGKIAAGGWGAMVEALQQTTPPAKPESKPDTGTHSLATMSGEEIDKFLQGPNAWMDPGVRGHIDAWLGQALPEFAAKEPTARYEKWGRIVGRGITIAGDPEISEDRYNYLWRNAARFPSLNLCTMKVYVERSIKGESLADCRRNVSAPTEAGYNAPGLSLDEQMDAAVRDAGLPGRPASLGFIPRKMSGRYLQALENIPPEDWINGKPDLDRIVVVLCYDPTSQESIQRIKGAELEFKKYQGWGYIDKQLAYVAIGQSDRSTLAAKIQQARITFPVASDIAGQTAAAFDAPGCTNETFLIGSKGEIVQKLSFYPRDPDRERFTPEEREEDSRIDDMLKKNRELHNNIQREIFYKFPSRK